MELGNTGSSCPVGLSSLPNEALLLILSNFCLHCRETPHEMPHAYFPPTQQRLDQPSWYSLDRCTLHSMCLVSKRFLPLSREILYHEFMPGYGDSWNSTRYEWFWRLTPFLRTVTLCPDLAVLVKRVHLDLNLLDCITEAEAEAALKDIAQVRGIQLSDFLGPFQNLLPTSIRVQYRPLGDEMVGMLLACLPNLKTLSLGATPCIPLSALRATGISSLPIQTLDICGCDLNSGRRLDGIVELAASTITTLNLNTFVGEGLRALVRHFPSLRNVCITNSKLIGSDLASFLSCCVGLESFSYESVWENDDFLPSDAVAHLIRNKETLNTLRLDIRSQKNTLFENNTPELIPHLKGFPVLRDLFINLRLVYSDMNKSPDILTQFLPPSIVSLQLAGNIETRMLRPLVDNVLLLAEATSQGKFPRLKRIRCDIGQRLDDYGLDERFASAGVDFGYDTWPFSYGMARRRVFSQANSPTDRITPVSSDDDL